MPQIVHTIVWPVLIAAVILLRLIMPSDEAADRAAASASKRPAVGAAHPALQ